MSMLVNADGTTKNYVAADYSTRTVVAAFNWAGEADKGVRDLSVGRKQALVFHNLTHPKIPDWLKELVYADPAYCTAKAAAADTEASKLRAKAAVLIAEAEAFDARATEWRERAETSTPSGAAP